MFTFAIPIGDFTPAEVAELYAQQHPGAISTELADAGFLQALMTPLMVRPRRGPQ